MKRMKRRHLFLIASSLFSLLSRAVATTCPPSMNNSASPLNDGLSGCTGPSIGSCALRSGEEASCESLLSYSRGRANCEAAGMLQTSFALQLLLYETNCKNVQVARMQKRRIILIANVLARVVPAVTLVAVHVSAGTVSARIMGVEMAVTMGNPALTRVGK